MNKFQRIKEIVAKYQKDSDKLFEEYRRKEKMAREKYSPEGFKSEWMMKQWPHYSGTARGNAENTIRNINYIYNEIINDFHQWVMEPLKPNILQTLTLISQFNLRLSLTELKTIEHSASDSYFGFRIFSELAKKAGFAVNTLDVDVCTKELESAKRNTENAIKMYAGQAPDFPGRDLLGEWTYNGINYGEYQTHHLLYAADFLRDNGVIDRLESIWISLKAPAKFILTRDESETIKGKIDDIIDPYGGAVEKEKAEKLLEEIPDILSRLESIPEDFKNKKAAVDYFTLIGVGAEQKAKEDAIKNESKIDPASTCAEGASNRFQKIDAESLKNFK